MLRGVVSPLLHIALYRPLIPQNTGTIGRLALGIGARLHLVHPLGFQTDEKACRRAGLDYWRDVDCLEHPDLEALLAAVPDRARVFALSARATRLYTDVEYRPGDTLLFGDEERGLPQAIVDEAGDRALRIPLRSPRVRSLNLANAASIVAYEALRQLGFPDPAPPRAPHEPAHAR
jgi:tRNA (cytidine/uridine-2'-O-)-methyltransferase